MLKDHWCLYMSASSPDTVLHGGWYVWSGSYLCLYVYGILPPLGYMLSRAILDSVIDQTPTLLHVVKVPMHSSYCTCVVM